MLSNEGLESFAPWAPMRVLSNAAVIIILSTQDAASKIFPYRVPNSRLTAEDLTETLSFHERRKRRGGPEGIGYADKIF